MRPIDQQTILITGATDGLGRALAARLAAEGATVLVHGRDDQRGKATLQEIGSRASWYRADLSSVAETRALAEAVRTDHPGWTCWSTTPAWPDLPRGRRAPTGTSSPSR